MEPNVKKLILALLFLTTACASAGVKVDQSKMAQFHKGQTTYDDVIAALGKPSQSSVDDMGNRSISYIYASTQARPETFIPVVGAFVGGADTENSAATFNFDARGILVKSSQTQGGMGVGTNLEGMSQDRKDVREAE
jgi:hypothetical protein